MAPAATPAAAPAAAQQAEPEPVFRGEEPAAERAPTLADLLPTMVPREESHAADLASLPTREQELGWDEQGDPEEPDRSRRGIGLLRRRDAEPDTGQESSEMIAWLDEVFAPRPVSDAGRVNPPPGAGSSPVASAGSQEPAVRQPAISRRWSASLAWRLGVGDRQHLDDEQRGVHRPSMATVATGMPFGICTVE